MQYTHNTMGECLVETHEPSVQREMGGGKDGRKEKKKRKGRKRRRGGKEERKERRKGGRKGREDQARETRKATPQQQKANPPFPPYRTLLFLLSIHAQHTLPASVTPHVSSPIHQYLRAL